ncbi:hypothetical protein [Alcaligenes endophyticus]|nr:hypothetical protein [Alcaligenes endophyticus]MCX5590746.1 hypothetical protein [Alcaligenes endophyticus]
MAIFKSSEAKNQEKGLSLLQGLGILAILGIVASLIARYFAG